MRALAQGTAPDGFRAAKLDDRLRDLAQNRGIAPEGCYGAIAVLVADAILEGDTETLKTALNGLKRVYARHELAEQPPAVKAEARGRLLMLVELVTWTLRRGAAPAAAVPTGAAAVTP